MIITVTGNSQGPGSGPVDYVLSERDHKGDRRKEKPEIIYGDPELTKAIIDSLDFKHKYISVVFSFREGEAIDRESFQKILKQFHNAVTLVFQ